MDDTRKGTISVAKRIVFLIGKTKAGSRRWVEQVGGLYSTRLGLRALASGMRQLAGTRKRDRRAYATPLAGLNSGHAEYNGLPGLNVNTARECMDSSNYFPRGFAV